MTVEITLTKGMKTIIDDCDADLIDFKWYVAIQGANYYARKNDNQNKTCIHLHRVILSRILGRDLLNTEFCDHVNGNGLDNRRENLRLADLKQNSQNRGMRKDNISGFKGVSWYKRYEKWRAQIKADGKKISLGYFENIEDAVKAYREAAVKYYGEFARFE